MTASDVTDALSGLANPEKAAFFPRFFKTGPGEYGEGDQFIGVVVPDQRQVARQFKDLPLSEIRVLIRSKIHEHRLTALFILVGQFEKSNNPEPLVQFYLANLDYVNNWDLVDSSCHKILGPWLENGDRTLLYDFAKTDHLWKQRMAMMTCFHFIRKKDFTDAFAIAELLIDHDHDLIHKVVGWMLREIGKRDLEAEENFLKPRYTTIPRTMLRYAIEKFDEPKRKAYLAGTIR